MKIEQIAIAIDSFKGCASSMELTEAISKGILAACPTCKIIKIPIADGGEGSVQALTSTYITVNTKDPLFRPIQAKYGIAKDEKTALIEISAASGLALLETEEYNVMHASTYGTGLLIADAIKRGYRQFILFLGGSATNDAGLGIMQALGFCFYNKENKKITPCGGNLIEINHIDRSKVLPELRDCSFSIACDVKSPFCGPMGAAYTFGKQKGGSPTEIAEMDKGLQHLLTLFKSELLQKEGAGAAGGAGGGCMFFLNAQMESGIEFVKNLIQFDQLIKGSNFIITGEGKMDEQTLQGKVPLGVLHSAQKQNIPVIALTGCVKDSKPFIESGFTSVLCIQQTPLSLTDAMKKETALYNIEQTARSLIQLVQI